MLLFRWSKIIKESHQTMKKVILSIGKVVDSDFSPEDFSTNDLKRIFNINVWSEARDINYTLKSTPLLESLKFYETSTIEESISLPRLKTLRTENTEVLELIKDTTKLKSLEVADVSSGPALNNFLMNLSALTSLEIGKTKYLFNDNCICKVPFKLTKFVMRELSAFFMFRDENIFKQFLMLHQATLKQLSLCLVLNNSILNFTLTNFSNLDSLELNVSNLPTEKSFYCCLPSMETIKTLKLNGRFEKHEVAKAFLSIFHALESLDMNKVIPSLWFSKFLKTISSLYKNLQHLSVPILFKGTPPNLQFKKLKSFHIGSIYCSKFLLNFLANHLELEELSLADRFEEGKLESCDVQKLLKYLPKLRHIRYQAPKQNIRKFYNIICKDFKQLNSITFAVIKNIQTTEFTEGKIILPLEQKYRKSDRYDSFINTLITKATTSTNSIGATTEPAENITLSIVLD